MKIQNISTLVICILFSTSVMAGPFSITNRVYPTGTGQDAAVEAAISSAFDDLETQVNDELPDISGGESYAEAMANSTAIAGRSIGVDYNSDMDLFMVGVRLGIAADVGSNSLSDVMSGDVDEKQIAGFGAGLALAGGLNLGMFDFSKNQSSDSLFRWDDMNLFFNVFKYDIDQDDVNANTTTFGVHLQWKWIKARPIVPYFFKWTGVQLTTGYEYNHLEASVSQSITETFTETVNIGGNQTVEATTSGTATIGMDVTTHSIPIEITTGAQLLYFLTFYTGLGASLNFGSGSANVDLNTPISADISGTINGNASGTAVLDLGLDSGPTLAMFRGFGGVQFNFWIAKLYFQFDKVLNEDIYAAKTGLSVVW
ncbi:MAG: Lsa36 family surface (lipo)protein [Bacteriovoracaceae bacterium]